MSPLQADKKRLKPIEAVLALLPDAKEHGDWYECKCPSHQDKNTSFGFIETAHGSINFKCFAGCTRENILSSLGLTEEDVRGDGRPKFQKKQQPGITLWDLAVDKNIHPNILRSFGIEDGYTWTDTKGKKHPNVIRIPYYDRNGKERSKSRIRTNVVAKMGSYWEGPKDDPLHTYGEDQLGEALKLGFGVIDEGETDWLTLRMFGFPALGIPGADNVNVLDAAMLEGIDRIYIIQELTDQAGREFPKKVTAHLIENGYKGQCFAVPLMQTHDVKDPNALLQRLYRENRINDFRKEFQDALDRAIPIETPQQATPTAPTITKEQVEQNITSAIESENVRALFDLADQLVELDTTDRELLSATIKSKMEKCKLFSWAGFRKRLREAESKKQQRKQSEKVYVSGRPQILLGRQLREEGDEALSVLYKTNTPLPYLYARSGKLVRIRVDEEDNPVIQHFSESMMIERLTRIADFVTYNEQKESYSSAYPTGRIANFILDQEHWQFPALRGIVRSPVLRPDGSILNQPGYDAQTRRYYAPQGKLVCSVPPNPTRRDAKGAAAFLLSIIKDFPFKAHADKANMMAAMLTPVVQTAIESDSQAAIIDATKPGTGKGYLCHLISVITTGKLMSAVKLPKTDEEFEKRIVGKLLAGASMIAVDNVSYDLYSPTLETLLTAGGEHTVRPLGTSDLITVQTHVTWVINGNNIQLKGDLARRCYRIRLISPVSNPEERTDIEIKDFLTYIQEHRGEILAALLTMARAWYIDGKPQSESVPNLGSFSTWAKTVGGILEFAGISGFQENRAELKQEANTEEGQWENFLHTWRECFQDKWIPVSAIIEEITKTSGIFAVVAVVSNHTTAQTTAKITLTEALPDSLKIAREEKPKTFNLKLARALEKRIETPYGKENIRIEKRINPHTKNNEWRVVAVVAVVAVVNSHSNVRENNLNFNGEENENKIVLKSNIEQKKAINPPQPPQTLNGETPSNGSTSQSTTLESVAVVSNQTTAKNQTTANEIETLLQAMMRKFESAERNGIYNQIWNAPGSGFNTTCAVDASEFRKRFDEIVASGDLQRIEALIKAVKYSLNPDRDAAD